MSSYEQISAAFEDALVLPLNSRSRYILLSDCHRGCGRVNDNFLKNEFLYLAALEFYYRQGFTCLELGDGDELWENRSFRKIKEMHPLSFEMLSRYYQSGRLYAVYGNHDIVKKNPKYVKKHFHTGCCTPVLCEHPLFPGITFYSGIILRDEGAPYRRYPVRNLGRNFDRNLYKNSAGNSPTAVVHRKDIYLLHGHQADPLNSAFWRLSRFLVRYLWKPLETLGIPDPTSAAKNNTKKKKSEKLLTKWAQDHDLILITGHTHHPMVGTKDSPYCNTGSCIHPAGITGIEIENRCMTLVKWNVQARADMTLAAVREVLGETVCVDDY